MTPERIVYRRKNKYIVGNYFFDCENCGIVVVEPPFFAFDAKPVLNDRQRFEEKVCEGGTYDEKKDRWVCGDCYSSKA